MALKNYLDYDGLLYWKQKFQVWISTKFALKTDIPTTLPADGGNADTVNGHTVATNVPENAKFTDTVYSHPANHPASMITEDTTHRFVTDAEQTKYETAYTHSQAAHAPTNAERNIVVGIQKNGTDVSVDSNTRKANITVPTKVSELSNDSKFQTQSQVSAAISAAIGNITGMICDGAKPSCAMKVSSGVSTAMLSALMAMENKVVTPVEGIIDEDVDKSIINLTSIGSKGMEATDKLVLDIMTGKSC